MIFFSLFEECTFMQYNKTIIFYVIELNFILLIPVTNLGIDKLCVSGFCDILKKLWS